MQNVCTRGKGRTFYVKKDIPSDVRHAFGGKAQVWRSLGTANKGEALPRAAAILTELDARIAAARASVTPATILKKLMAGDDVTPTDAKGAINAAMAVCGLKDGHGLVAEQLLSLLTRCLALVEATPTASGLSHVRRAACRLDELFYPL